MDRYSNTEALCRGRPGGGQNDITTPNIESIRISVEITIEMVSDIRFVNWIGILSLVFGILALSLITCYRRILDGDYRQARSYQVRSPKLNPRAMTRVQLLHVLRTVILAAALFEKADMVQNWVKSNPRLKTSLDQAQQAILSGHTPDQVVSEFSTYLIQTLSQIRPLPYYAELLAHLNVSLDKYRLNSQKDLEMFEKA